MGVRKISVAQGSLTEGESDVLINASNTNLELGSGVSGAIRMACGRDYQATLHQELERRFDGPMEPGQVLITHAGTNANAKYVAHAAIMDYRQGFNGSSYPTLALVEESYARIWQGLAELGKPNLSVAIVALGGGTGNLGVREPMQRACQTLKRFLAGPQAAALGDLCFYGYSLVEYIATIEVVSEHFPLPPESIPPEVARYLQGQEQP